MGKGARLSSASFTPAALSAPIPPSTSNTRQPGAAAASAPAFCAVRLPDWQWKITVDPGAMPSAAAPSRETGAWADPGTWLRARSSASRISTSTAWPEAIRPAASRAEMDWAVMAELLQAPTTR